MKTKDLRLGNYVTDNSGFTMYVVGIYEDTVLLNFKGNEGDVWEVDEKDLKPIALDKEMLLKLGYKIYVDDFGTGYATLSYLKSLPIAGVKIDKSFIDNIDKCKRDLDMLKGVIGLIKTLELEVVCEGVERLSQLNLLRELGVTNIQGFLYYRPMKGNEIVAELKHSSDKERKEVTTEDFIEELELNLARG